MFIHKPRSEDMFPSQRYYKIWTTRYSGKVAGSCNPYGNNLYVRIYLLGVPYFAHRIAWKMFYGEEPPEVIDHVDNDGTNNAIRNLRKATPNQNMWNSKISVANTSGHKGVCFHRRIGKWISNLKVNNKKIHLGYFDTAEDAAKAHNEAAVKYHGSFARYTK